MKRAQARLFELRPHKARAGGGASHLKAKRPFVPRLPVHLVMRSNHARGALNLKRHESTVKRIIFAAAKRNHVSVRSLVNVGNHLHLKARATRVENFQNFLRATTNLIARAVTGAQKGRPFRDAKGEKQRFWTSLVFSRIVGTHREEKILDRYLLGNLYESEHGPEVRKWFFDNYPFRLPKTVAG